LTALVDVEFFTPMFPRLVFTKANSVYQLGHTLQTNIPLVHHNWLGYFIRTTAVPLVGHIAYFYKL